MPSRCLVLDSINGSHVAYVLDSCMWGLQCGDEGEKGSRQSGNLWKLFSNTSDKHEPRVSHLTSSYSLSCLVGSHQAGSCGVAPHWWVSTFTLPSVLSNEKHLHPVNFSFALIKGLDVGYWGLCQARWELVSDLLNHFSNQQAIFLVCSLASTLSKDLSNPGHPRNSVENSVFISPLPDDLGASQVLWASPSLCLLSAWLCLAGQWPSLCFWKVLLDIDGCGQPTLDCRWSHLGYCLCLFCATAQNESYLVPLKSKTFLSPPDSNPPLHSTPWGRLSHLLLVMFWL